MQFYCEHVFDLLADDSARRLEVCNLAAGQLARGQERVTGLVWTPVDTCKDALVRPCVSMTACAEQWCEHWRAATSAVQAHADGGPPSACGRHTPLHETAPAS